MYKSSNTFSFLTFLLVLFSFTLPARDVIRLRAERATDTEKATLQQHFKAFTLATMSPEQTSTLLRSKDFFPEISLQVADQEYDFNLIPHDVRSADYKLLAWTDNGLQEFPRSPNKTYYGYTQGNNLDVRITSDEDFFSAMIVTEHDIIYIEPAGDYVSGSADNMFIIYRASDAIKKFTLDNCGVKRLPTHQLDPEQTTGQTESNSRDACKTVQIALADDKSMFNKYGSVEDVEAHNMTNINNVLTNYDTEFSTDLDFNVTQIFVVTGTDPWTNSTDPGALLDDFTAWGPSGFSGTHDVASLWSNRNFDGSTIGLAWIGTVCGSHRYNVLQDFSTNGNLLRVLQAHEMGHNFNADHDPDGSMTIMAPAVSNTNTWSANSLNVINAFIPTRTCLSTCSPPAPPVAAFDADPTDGCASLQVFFDDQSTNNPTSWLWSFPGGSPSTSTMQNPVITYNTAGSYNVTLTVTNAQGSDSEIKTNFITVSNEPFADFDYQTDNFSVDFENLSQFATSYNWNFGDGQTSTQSNPIHVYAEDGTYHVVLTASNDCGSDMISVNIEIVTPPYADFSSDETDGCSPLEVHFENFSSDNSTSWTWTFPGGSPATSTQFEPTVLYETPGSYAVTLVAHNDAGQDAFTIQNYIVISPEPTAAWTYTANGLVITFNSSLSQGEDFLWHFGDGQTSTQHNPVHTYAQGGTYTVTLDVTSQCGIDHAVQTINVAGAPLAGFAADDEDGCAPFVVHFINTSQGIVNSFNWTFQGGTPATSTAANPTVTYNNAGTFDVTLTVTNNAGSNTLTLQDFITVSSPTISGFDYFISGAQVSFTNESQYSTGSVWLFGDGEQSTETNPSHIYDADGDYIVKLISAGICGPDTSMASISVHTPPQSGFTTQQTGSCSPVSVSFINTSSNNATSFAWTFAGGNPATSTLENPVVSYSVPGTYDVQLIAFSTGGSDTTVMTSVVSVGNTPNAAFLLATDSMSVTLTNQSDNADSYIWLFDDGNSSNEESPSHTYNAFGVYELTLIAFNECGSDTMMVVIELSTVPNSYFSYSAHNGCAPFDVQFLDQSQNNPTSWQWTFEGGNPATSTQQNPLVSYSAPGNYTVSLTVQNSHGSDVLVLDDVITVAGQPDATFTYNQIQNIVSLEYQGTDYDSLRWNFGDGRTDNSLNPTVEYAPGQYTIQLVVFNACGIDTSSVVVDITTATQDPSLDSNQWQLRPNPFRDVLNLYGEPKEDGALIIILRDLAGKVISTQQFNHGTGSVATQISGGNLASGLYLIELRTDKGSTILKAVHND